MQRESKVLIIYLLIMMTLYYGLPALIGNIGSEADAFVRVFLLPFVCFFGVLIYYLRPGMKWFFFIIMVACMIPWMFVFFSQHSWVYLITYDVIVGVAACMGMFLHIKIEN